MKSSTKRTVPLLAVFLFAAALMVSIQLTFAQTAFAADEDNIGRTYYYEELKNSPMAQKFYGVFDEMAKEGHFKNGRYEYDLVAKGVLTEAEVSDYVDNETAKIPVAFGSARDAFYMDHPDLFYADVYKVYLSAGMQNGKYVAFAGTGRAENYFADNTVTTEAEANAAIAKYETAIGKIVADAQAASADAVGQITYVNNFIAQNVQYSYGAFEDAHNGKVHYNGYVNTAYGALVGHEAMCGGYARAFKAVMDRLNIPCVLIQGASRSEKNVAGMESGLEAHMWNAVCLDGLWYGVDPTWNATANDPRKYLLVGDDFLSGDHFEDGVISSSGFELKYPALRPFNYGVTEDTSGFAFKDSGTIGSETFGYVKSESSDNHTLTLGISFEGKNIVELQKDGKYFAYRYDAGNGWSKWFCLYASTKAMLEASGYNEQEAEVWWNSMVAEHYTIQYYGYDVNQVQFAVFDCVPADGSLLNGFAYSEEEASGSRMIAVSVAYSNDAYMKYIPAPYVTKMVPANVTTLTNLAPQAIEVKYSEELVYAEGKSEKDLAIQVDTKTDASEYCKCENIKWDAETQTLSLMFTPSHQYRHYFEWYDLTPVALVGKDSGKVPESARVTYKMKQVVCPKVFNDGRLYIHTYGDPQFVSASDESLNGFKDKDGKPIVGDQRSQLMLVVNEPSKAESQAMEDALLDSASGTGLAKEDIKASATYQIDLQMCGLIQKVPTGSFMQVGFGFPEGYGPDDAGVTFTVYHYTRKPNGEIDTVEAVPCVITEYGIVATVKSFSPFMICAVDAKKAPAGETVYASVFGAGGTVKSADNEPIKTLKTGESVTYAITPDSGYQVDKVLLNGQDITSRVAVSGGNLTIAYADLGDHAPAKGSNTLQVTFVAERVATYNEEQGITIVQPKIVVTQADMIKVEESADPEEPSKPTDRDDKGCGCGGSVASASVFGALTALSACVVLATRKRKALDK